MMSGSHGRNKPQKRKKDEFDNDYREDWQRNHKHSPDERQRISHSEKCFTVHPRNKYNTSAPAFRKPMFVGDFCLDENRMFCHDKRNLHYININWQESKKVDFDLNIAMDKMIKKNFQETRKEKLDRLLQWILCDKFKFHTRDSEGKPLQCLSTDFVCFRGLLTELLCTPYESREGWIICATKYRGTIYLCAYETPEKLEQRENETEVQKKMCSWGYKFEHFMTEGTNVNEGINENEEYCCVVRSRLENHSLVYGAEVDGADPEKYKNPHSDLSAFVELKTSKELNTDRDLRSLYRFKLMKWWSQSYLVGIPRVVAGFRDMDGHVHTLKTYHVNEMPHMAQDHWQDNIMLNFLNQFLSFVKKNVQKDDPRTVYKFERQKQGGDIYCTYLGQDPAWTFLPKWYYEKIFQPEDNSE